MTIVTVSKDTKVKQIFAENYGHKIMRTFKFYQIFFSSQVKRSMVISNKYDIYELPNELPKDF